MHFNFRVKYLIIIFSIIIGYFILYKYSNLTDGHFLCLFKFVTNIPCAGCGTTRATILLLKGHLGQSILINPLGIIVAITLSISIFWMLFDIVRNKKTFFPFLNKKRSSRFILFFVLLTLVNWAWNIYKGV